MISIVFGLFINWMLCFCVFWNICFIIISIHCIILNNLIICYYVSSIYALYPRSNLVCFDISYFIEPFTILKVFYQTNQLTCLKKASNIISKNTSKAFCTLKSWKSFRILRLLNTIKPSSTLRLSNIFKSNNTYL